VARLQRIEEIINSTISHYGHTKVFPRGLPSFVDSLLRGAIRFAKRTGNNIAVLNPDNTYSIAEDTQLRDNKITLVSVPEWVIPGAILSIGPGKELHYVDDVAGNVIHLKNQLVLTYTTADQVLLFAYPLLLAVDTTYGDTSVVVKSHYKMGNGDVFGYLHTQSLIQSFTGARATEALFLGTTADPFNNYLYQLNLDQPIQRIIPAGTTVYMRAYPGYFSPSIRVPNALFTSEPLGPFLLDLFSGMLLEGNTFRETFAIKTINRSGAFVVGDGSTYVTTRRNAPIFDRPIAAHVPLFWELAEGTMRITPNRVVLKMSDKFVFSTGIKCVPPFPANKQWQISAKATEDCTLRFFFNPHPFVEYTLLSGSTTSISVPIPPGDDVTDIEINVRANSSACEVQLSDWTSTLNIVENIEYSLVVEAVGQATYQSTGLLLKPFFLGSEFLKATWDSGELFDGGKVYF